MGGGNAHFGIHWLAFVVIAFVLLLWCVARPRLVERSITSGGGTYINNPWGTSILYVNELIILGCLRRLAIIFGTSALWATLGSVQFAHVSFWRPLKSRWRQTKEKLKIITKRHRAHWCKLGSGSKGPTGLGPQAANWAWAQGTSGLGSKLVNCVLAPRDPWAQRTNGA